MTRRQIIIVIIALMGGMFLSSLDQTVVGTSMRTIADDLDGLSLQAWVTTAYLILSTISTPIYGKLSDIFGRRPLFLIAISIFLGGSLLSGSANSMYELAIFRAIQGLGAGGLMALPLTIMGDIFTPRDRAKYQGFFLAVFGVSSVIGPLIGGLFASANTIFGIAGWRWVFLINLPVGLVALAIVLRFLHIPYKKRPVPIDWWGAVTVIIMVVPLLLVCEQGRTWGWWSPLAIACYVIGVGGIVLFIVVEKFAGDNALIPLKLFHSPTFFMVTILSLFSGFATFGAWLITPLYLQVVIGVSPTQSGLLMLAIMAGLITASITSGQLISRTGRYKIFLIGGTFFMSTGFLCFTLAAYDKFFWLIIIGMVIVGLGIGQIVPTLTIVSQSAVNARDIGVATSSATFFRQIGGTLGTAILFSVLFTRLPEILEQIFSNAATQQQLASAMHDPSIQKNPANTTILSLLQNPANIETAFNGNTAFLTTADPRLAGPFVEGFATATVPVFFVSFGIAFIAFVLSFFLKTTPLRNKSALQESMDFDEAIAAQLAADETGALIAPDTGSLPIIPPDRTQTRHSPPKRNDSS